MFFFSLFFLFVVVYRVPSIKTDYCLLSLCHKSAKYLPHGVICWPMLGVFCTTLTRSRNSFNLLVWTADPLYNNFRSVIACAASVSVSFNFPHVRGIFRFLAARKLERAQNCSKREKWFKPAESPTPWSVTIQEPPGVKPTAVNLVFVSLINVLNQSGWGSAVNRSSPIWLLHDKYCLSINRGNIKVQTHQGPTVFYFIQSESFSRSYNGGASETKQTSVARNEYGVFWKRHWKRSKSWI